MDFEAIIWGAAEWWGKALFVVGTYYFGRELGRQIPKDAGRRVRLQRYAYALGVVAVFSLFMWSGYGTHSEDDGTGDPLFGGGRYDVVDFEPTPRERDEYGLRTFLTLAVPILLGVSAGLPRLSLAERIARDVARQRQGASAAPRWAFWHRRVP